MEQITKNQTELDAYNEAVQDAFFNVVETVRHWLSKIEHPTFRQTFIEDNPTNRIPGSTIYSLLHPFIFLKLYNLEHGEYGILYGYETTDIYTKCKPVVNVMMRSLIFQTSKANTVVDVERSVLFDCFVTGTSDVFADRQRDPKLVSEVIPYIG